MNRIDKKADGTMAYIWHRILKISWTDVFSYFAMIITICVGWLALEKHINGKLISLVIQWIEPIDQTKAVIALYTIVFLGITIYIYQHLKKNAHLSLNGLVFWTLLTIVYTYYRCDEQSPLEFWKLGWWAWMDVLYIIDVVLIGCVISYAWRILTFDTKEAVQNSDLLRDDAIELDKEDRLGYLTIADELTLRIGSVDLSRKAFSVGIVGEWGLGKSSLLNLFVKQQREAGQIIVRFNPRTAKKADLIQEEFFSIFSHALSKYSFNAHSIVGKYSYALNLYSSTKWVYAIIDLFENWTSELQKQRINDLIRSTGRKVYVIIEDLDRLTGPEIIEVLKLIDANGNFCNTVFLTAYDKDYLNGVLKKQIGYGDKSASFTDKYFQYELYLFRHISDPIHRFLNTYMCDWVYSLWEDEYAKQRISKEWPMVCGKLLSQLTTMRHAKRYVNIFRSSYKKIKEHVDFGDYAIVTLIRYFDLESYYALYAKRYIQHPGKIFDEKESWILKEGYEKLTADSKIPNLSGLLEYLFNSEYRQFESRYNKINRAESFDNYFYDKIEGVLYYEDLNRMITAESFDEGKEIIRECKDIERRKQSVIEFLCMQDPSWIQTRERLVRYIEILIYADEQIGDLEVQQQLIGMFLVETQRQYTAIVDKNGYEECLKEAIDEMLPISPLSIGGFFKFRLKARYGDASDWQENLIDTLDYDHYVLMRAQLQYDELRGSEEWNARSAISLGTPVKGEDNKYAMERAEFLRSMMDLYPDTYAKGMICLETSDFDRTYTLVKLSPYDELQTTVGDMGLMQWSKNIKDENIRYIVQHLMNNKNKDGYPNERIELYMPTKDKNYELIADAFKKM